MDNKQICECSVTFANGNKMGLDTIHHVGSRLLAQGALKVQQKHGRLLSSVVVYPA